MPLIFFAIKRIVHKEFVLAGQTVNSAYCCDVLQQLHENMRRFHSELWQQKNWLLHYNNALSYTSFFTREFLTKNNMTVITYLSYFSLFPQLKIKLKGRHFDSAEVIEAVSQAVLNTLTEKDFQNAFKKWQKCWEWYIYAWGLLQG
jgi:hypothetical protein